MLDPRESLEEIKSREVELGSESWTSFTTVFINENQVIFLLPRARARVCVCVRLSMYGACVRRVCCIIIGIIYNCILF